MIGGEFCFKTRVYYQDTDCEGVVYYANYLTYFERARMEYLEHSGLDLLELKDKGVLFAVAKAEISYKFPARLGDILDIYTKVEKVGASKIVFSYEVRRDKDNKLLALGSTVLVCISEDFRPIPLPEFVRKKIVI